MLQKRASAQFHIVCSDQPRTGKTLFSRLLTDYLILTERSPLVFDAAPGAGGMRRYFPSRSCKADISTTEGQMALFDRALTPPLQDCVVDLSAHLVADVFELMRHIDFGDAAHTPDLGVVIYFVTDGSTDSLTAGRKLRAGYPHGRFIAVKNQAVFPAVLGGLADLLYWGLAKEGQVVVPVLEGTAIPIVKDTFFSFSRFAQDVPLDVPQGAREVIRSFLSDVYQQFDGLGLENGGHA